MVVQCMGSHGRLPAVDDVLLSLQEACGRHTLADLHKTTA
jgi:hypothetical protein